MDASARRRLQNSMDILHEMGLIKSMLVFTSGQFRAERSVHVVQTKIYFEEPVSLTSDGKNVNPHLLTSTLPLSRTCSVFLVILLLIVFLSHFISPEPFLCFLKLPKPSVNISASGHQSDKDDYILCTSSLPAAIETRGRRLSLS